jgi:hypothetical protein
MPSKSKAKNNGLTTAAKAVGSAAGKVAAMVGIKAEPEPPAKPAQKAKATKIKRQAPRPKKKRR